MKRVKRLQYFLERLSDQVRLPSMSEFHVIVGNFEGITKTAPKTDINIFGLSDELSFDYIRSISKNVKSSCLFVEDSGQESALV